MNIEHTYRLGQINSANTYVNDVLFNRNQISNYRVKSNFKYLLTLTKQLTKHQT